MKYITHMPHALPKDGKAIVHNRVHAQWEDQTPGEYGFRVWITYLSEHPNAELCDCGWSGLPHYRVDAPEGTPGRYGKPSSVKGKRMHGG
jgi:hypothetical protein